MNTQSVVLRLPVARRRPFPARATAIVGCVLAVALIGPFVASNVYASLAQRSLADRWDAAAARYQALDPVERSGITYGPGDPIARLQIPSISLDAVVVEGASPSIMRRGPGHLPGSATPGEDGVAIVTANRFGFGGFFVRLDRLSVGDTIAVQSAIGRTTYTVMEVRVVAADQLDLATESSLPVLVLFGNARLWGGPDRIVVRAVAGGV